MMRRPSLTIENKILIPFVTISIVTVLCFCYIVYNAEYKLRIETETANATALVDYINADIDAGEYWRDPNDLLEKYEQSYRGDNLFLYDAADHLLFSRRALGEHEILLCQSSSNSLGWKILCSLDQAALTSAFIEEQRYLILAVIAMLIIIVQAGVMIAHNISAPIRELSALCVGISAAPGEAEELSGLYTHRRDEVGQFAQSFQKMMESLHRYTDELSWVKALNESIVENLPLGIAVYDGAGEMIFHNSRAETILCAVDECDAQGRALGDYLSDLVRRGEVLPISLTLHDSAKKSHHYELGVWRLQSGDANLGTLCTVDDVTYQRHMEEKLSRDEKLTYTGELAADIAHEARNPLAGIRTGLQVIDRKLESERDHLLCHEMIKEVDRVDLLVSNLVNISRQRESEKTTVHLDTLCEEMELLYSKVAENKGIEFFANIDTGIVIFADEQEVRQMLINLINNSIKAMPDGGQILLSGRAEEGGVCVSISDNGPGMDEVHLSRALSGEGGGLGLSIVQRLAKNNNGELELTSAPGEGTSAHLLFHRTGGICYDEV